MIPSRCPTLLYCLRSRLVNGSFKVQLDVDQNDSSRGIRTLETRLLFMKKAESCVRVLFKVEVRELASTNLLRFDHEHVGCTFS